MGTGMSCLKSSVPALTVLACLALGGCVNRSQRQAADRDPEVRVWAAGSTEKIQPTGRSELPHTGPWDASLRRVRIEGVRGEHVPFHVVGTAAILITKILWPS